MNTKIIRHGLAAAVGALLLLGTSGARADEYADKDAERWTAQFMQVVQKGRELWTSPDLGKNGVVCAQCHPNAANSHPETYPKFQKQIGKVVTLPEMINWCIRNTLEGQPLELDSQEMTALVAYATYERRGVKLEPGKH